MGANAQTSVPTFTAGDVLTAANMNISARTGVPVFADTTARDAAFGGTGEKTLAEGQLCYVENLTGVAQIQYYDGAAWVSLTAGGLVRISGETTFSASSSITFDSAFSSTYRNYKLVINYTMSTTSNLLMRFRTGGASVSTTTYNNQYVQFDSTTVTAARTTAQTSNLIGGATDGAFNSSIELLIRNPNVATPTTIIAHNALNRANYTTGTSSYFFTGNQSDSTQFTGFELLPASGTTTGNYTLYGLATS